MWNFTMAIIMIYKRNTKLVYLHEIVEKLSTLGLSDTLKEYYDNPFSKEARSIVAGPSFLQFLNRLF